jgi:glycosyltransferase involved in cell wall biosynthesis
MRVLLYSNVKKISSFNLSKFYLDDINVLTSLGYDVITSNKILKILQIKKCNGVLIYFYSKGFILAIIAKILGKKVVFTGGVDDLQISKFLSIKSFIFIICYIFSDVCNAVSKSDYKRLHELITYFSLNPKKLIYSPHYINLDISYHDEKKDKIITTICWLGSISNVKRKGVDKLLYFFNEIKNYGYTLQIIGGGEVGAKYLKEIANKLGIENQTIFLGGISHEEKYQALSKSKYYFQLSDYEGFGLAVLEGIYFHNYIFHSGAGGLADTIALNGTILSSNDLKNFSKIFDEVEKKFYLEYDFFKIKNYIQNSFSFDKRVNFFKNIYN